MRVLSELEPKNVFSFFEDICNIPHPSYKEEKISNYLVDFAKERKLEYYQDSLNNVIIIKEASKGYEDAAPIILQGHMDMVCEKTPDCDKNMDVRYCRHQVLQVHRQQLFHHHHQALFP